MTEETDNLPRRAAAPSKRARFLAFIGIIAGGICGGLAGFSFSDLQGDSATVAALWALGGGVLAAAGVAIVATLILRAQNEWDAK